MRVRHHVLAAVGVGLDVHGLEDGERPFAGHGARPTGAQRLPPGTTDTDCRRLPSEGILGPEVRVLDQLAG